MGKLAAVIGDVELMLAVKRIADLQRELAAVRKERDEWRARAAESKALLAKAAYWKGVADRFSIEKYGRPCDAEPCICDGSRTVFDEPSAPCPVCVTKEATDAAKD